MRGQASWPDLDDSKVSELSFTVLLPILHLHSVFEFPRAT